VTGVVSRDDEQQGLHRRRQPTTPVQKDPLHTGGQVQLRRHRRGPGQLLVREGGGQLDERQRVPGGMDHQPVHDLVDHGGAGRLGEQRAGRRVGQTGKRQDGDTVGRERACVAVPGGEHDGDAVGTQPSRGDHHRLGGGLVEPVRVVDDAQQGSVLGRLSEHREGRERDQERLDCALVRQAERDAQRTGLRGREPIERTEDRPEQTVQCSERQLRLRLHSLGTQDPHVVDGVRDEVIEQRGLPGSGLPGHQQRSGASFAGPVEQRGQAAPLDLPTVQHPRDATPGPGEAGCHQQDRETTGPTCRSRLRR